MPRDVVKGLVMPRRSGWAIPDDALALLAGLVELHRPALILEAGSGRSTIVLADALRKVGSGRLIALEHQRKFADEANSILGFNDLDGLAEARFAPLSAHRLDLPASPRWYARRSWADLHEIAMLIVDGPPGHVSELAREPALPLLHDRLAAGAVIVLDDTHRSWEQEILRRWETNFPDLTVTDRVTHSNGQLAYAVLR